jgi:hypothetical protein
VPCGFSSNGRFLWEDGSAEVRWGIVVVVSTHDDRLDFKRLFWLFHGKHAPSEFLCLFHDFCGGRWLRCPLSFGVGDSKGPIHGLA